jgi:hypothetical protein
VSEDEPHSVVWDSIELNRNRSHFSLLSFVRFEYLSASSIRRFVEPASDSLDSFNSSIWSSVISCLVLPVSPDVANGRIAVPEIRGRVFAPNSALSLNEIISHLVSISGGNVHDLGVVVASGSGKGGSSTEAKRILDPQNHGSCFSSNR